MFDGAGAQGAGRRASHPWRLEPAKTLPGWQYAAAANFCSAHRRGARGVGRPEREGYPTNSGLILVRVRECPCGAEVVQTVFEALTVHLPLNADPVIEGRLLTLLLEGGKGTSSRLACRVLGPHEAGDRLAKMDLFREHSCIAHLAPIDRRARPPPSGPPPAVPGSGTGAGAPLPGPEH